MHTRSVEGSNPPLATWSKDQRLNGILAQLGEHLPYKQRVTGSSPVGPISFAKKTEERNENVAR